MHSAYVRKKKKRKIKKKKTQNPRAIKTYHHNGKWSNLIIISVLMLPIIVLICARLHSGAICHVGIRQCPLFIGYHLFLFSLCHCNCKRQRYTTMSSSIRTESFGHKMKSMHIECSKHWIHWILHVFGIWYAIHTRNIIATFLASTSIWVDVIA